MVTKANRFFASQAWVQGAWAKDVLLEVDTSGHWSHITLDAAPQTVRDAERLGGPVLPGVVNAHSHAFQRAIAGLTEQGASSGQDNFWSWRQRMYAVAQRITPEQLESIATMLYTELLAGGYTQVCEFHYLHNASAHASQASALEMSMALVQAAQRSGIGLTLLPTLYMRSGFGADRLHPDQQRFASTPASIARLVQDVQAATRGMAHVNLGVALHSLRAVTPQALSELAAFADAQGLPIHIHIAEQPQEVQDCMAHTGQRPIEWLLRHTQLHARWNLVHATHATQAELDGVRASSSNIVICPSTEANLGDGCSVPCMTIDALVHSAQACSARPLGGLQEGQRADCVVLDPNSPALCGLPHAHVLDAHVFSSPASAPLAVCVGGQWRSHSSQGAVLQDYARTLAQVFS